MKITVDQLNRKIHENWYYAKSMKIGIIIKILMKPSSILFVEATLSVWLLYCVLVEYYQNPSGKSAQAWNDLRQSIKSNTTVRLGSDTDVDIRFKLTKLHSHRPIFTNTIMLVCNSNDIS